MNYGPPTFDCKCVLCGHKVNFRECDIEASDGPVCPKCMGPMTVERVAVKRAPPRPKGVA
jgi:hypothetical protein